MLYTKEEIMNIIPQREPFLFVDSIESIEVLEDGQTKIIGYKTFHKDEEFFKGHFPNQPIVPGVILLEAIGQCGAIFCLSREEYKGKTAFLAGADNVKWKRMVLPEEKITLELVTQKFRHGMGKAIGKAFFNGELVCSAEMTTMIR